VRGDRWPGGFPPPVGLGDGSPPVGPGGKVGDLGDEVPLEAGAYFVNECLNFNVVELGRTELVNCFKKNIVTKLGLAQGGIAPGPTFFTRIRSFAVGLICTWSVGIL